MVLLLSIFFPFFVFAQDIGLLINELPFQNQVELEGLDAGKIKENTIHASHSTARIEQSKYGVNFRYFELENNVSEISRYSNISFGSSYQRYLPNDRSFTLSASYGSASNRPFRDGRDGIVNVNSLYRYNNHWLFLGNYSNNRAFLNNIPLPGVVYIHEQSRERVLVFGFPFVYFLRPIAQSGVSVRYTGLLPYTHKLRLIYTSSNIRPYIGFEQTLHSFFDSTRKTDLERTFFYERKAGLGIERSFGPFLRIDFQTGLAFNRKYFNARSFTRHRTESKTVEDGYFVGLNLKSMF
ncbi:MAG: hypothetical protein AB7I27_13435 [Bacteriovoracaceae bacterium]